jgi:hypothetical protein
LDALPEFGGAMKLTPTREAMPLSVWIVLVLVALGTFIHLTGVVVLRHPGVFSIGSDASANRPACPGGGMLQRGKPPADQRAAALDAVNSA